MGNNPNKPNAVPSSGESSTTSESEQSFQSWEAHLEEIGKAETTNESKPTPVDDSSKKEQLAMLLSQTKELAVSTENTAEQESSELVKFGVAEIPKELLGEEKVLVSELRDRPKFDFIGRRKDEKTLDMLLHGGSHKEAELKDLFTPTVAKLFLDRINEDKTGDYFSQGKPPGRLFEALPLEAQLSELSKKEKLPIFFSKVEEVEKGLANKLACGLTNNLLGPENGRIDDLHLSHIMESQIRKREEHPRGAIAHRLNSETALGLFEATSKTSFKKLDCAIAFLDEKDLFDKIDDGIMDRKISARDACILNAMINNPSAGELKEEWQAKYEAHFPLEFRSLAEAGIYLSYGNADAAEKEMALGKELEDTKKIREEIGLSKLSWFRLMQNAPILYGQIKNNQSLDEETKIKIKFYTEYGNRSDLGLKNNTKSATLESLKDIEKLYPIIARENIYVGDLDTAKRFIGYFAFGMGTAEIAQDLVSLGVAKIKRPGDYSALTELTSQFDEDIEKIKARKDMSALGDLSEDQKRPVLDAVSLLGCEEPKDLEEKLNVYEQRYSLPEERMKFKHLIAEAKDRMSEKLSKIYSERAQMSIQTGTRKISELEYGDKKIPILNMEGKNFFLLVHRLGAYSSKDRENPAQWNDDSRLYEHEKDTGYISTSAIADGSLKLAIGDENISNQDEIFYSFSKLGDKSIKTMNAYDTYTTVTTVSRGYGEDAKEIKTLRQDVFYEDPDKLIKNTKTYNEVVLDRYSGNPNEHGGRLQPSEIIVFTNDPSRIGDLPKKHAAYFGVPIIMIDPKKYK